MSRDGHIYRGLSPCCSVGHHVSNTVVGYPPAKVYPKGRKEGLRMLFGLGKCILGGQTELEQLKHVSSVLAEDYR